MIVQQKVRLTYPGPLRDRPLLSQLVREFELETNIVEARVADDEAWLVVLVSGEPHKLRQGLHWIAGEGVQVEVYPPVEERP